MDSNFGEFITKEYGLLKQILSYLKPCDLYNARFVCSEWRKAVDHLVGKSPMVISYKLGQKEPMPYPAKPILPDLVIYQNVVSKEFMKPDKCSVCKQSFLVCYCEVAGPETAVLLLNNLSVSSPYNSELYSFWQLPSVLVLSSPENIKLSTFYCDKNNKALSKHSNSGSLTERNETIKGIFIVSKSCCRKYSENLLNEIVDRQGPTFAVGGGLADTFVYNKEKHKEEEKHNGLYLIFKGDNVSSHSELITDRDQASVERSMRKLKESAGEVPKDGTRIAFIAQCVDRRDETLEKMESSLFRKYFPNIPQYGFPAWGEFGIKSGSSDGQGPRNKRKRKKLNFCHAYTTSILILTLRK